MKRKEHEEHRRGSTSRSFKESACMAPIDSARRFLGSNMQLEEATLTSQQLSFSGSGEDGRAAFNVHVY